MSMSSAQATRPSKRLVSLGPTDGESRRGHRGVAEGDQIIIGNLQKIGPGTPVRSLLSLRGERLRIRFELGKETLRRLVDPGFVRGSLGGERAPDRRNRKHRGQARHAELGEDRSERDGGAHAGERPPESEDDRRWAPEIFLEKMVEHVLERRLNGLICITVTITKPSARR